jgi:hypothetical protein
MISSRGINGQKALLHFPGVRVKPLCHLSDRQYIGLPSVLAQYFSKAIQASIVMWVKLVGGVDSALHGVNTP